jgi:phosphoglycolate/pyridoxal phosphate phosphatase family enzyme
MAPRGMKEENVDIRAVILDLDGVIYRGQTAVAGAEETVGWLSENSYQVYYFTNNSTKTRESYVELLAGYGLATDVEHVVTSASLTAQHFSDNGLLPATALVVGEGGLAEELRRIGVRVVRRRGKRPIDFVVVGMDRRFTYRKLHEAQQAIRAGATFIATNTDATYPVEDNVIPGGGSIVAAVATAAQQEPLLIGKPSARAGELITHHAGVKPTEALMVGDRLETDIEMGRRAGLWTCLVLTGISRAEEAAALPPEHRPHWIVDGIGQLPELLGSLAAGEGRAKGESA